MGHLEGWSIEANTSTRTGIPQTVLGESALDFQDISSWECFKDPGLGKISLCCLPAAPYISLYISAEYNYLFYICVLYLIISSQVGTMATFAHCSGAWQSSWNFVGI